MHFRPMEIDCWYPAQTSQASSPISYSYFLNLLQERSNRFQDDTLYNRITSDLVEYLSVNLNIADTSKLTRLLTASYAHAIPVQQNFPLIVYLCSYNGMSYENISLFEWLASHGYFVACITSVGRYPGNMSTQLPDLMEQVRDADFAIRYLKIFDRVDTERIGATGYSWGGLAAVLLAMNNKNVKCILSLDGSELHYYGDSREEDFDFNQIIHSPDCLSGKLNVPYAYLESGFKQSGQDADSIFHHFTFPGDQRLYIHFPKATHEDFSYLPSLGTRMNGPGLSGQNLSVPYKEFALYFFDDHLKNIKYELIPFLDGLLRDKTGDSIYPVVRVKKNLILIKGKIADEKNGEPLAFVNVGIRNKNSGTVSEKNGYFQLNIIPELKADSLTFSMAGYETRVISISDLIKDSKPVYLKEKVVELKEVTVTTKTIKTVIKGNTTTSDFFNIGLPLKFLGSETGIKLHLGKRPVLLKSFTFNISTNHVDTAVFRLNIYSFRKGVPFENILHQNILVPIGKQTGLYTIDLKKYKLVFDGDVLLSLEWIEGSSSGPGTGVIFLSAGLLNSATWHRLTSQAEWKKAAGLGVGFNVLVQEIKN